MSNRADIERMQELGEILRKAAKAYYAEDKELMSNLEYDKLYDELLSLEEKTGLQLSASPSLQVGYAAVDSLPKVEHESPMLSLDKTKDIEAMAAFAGSHKVLLSWKLDGLTIVLTYEGGRLLQAVTRGNGMVGEEVTENARVFKNLPVKIPFGGRLVLRGEALITYSDFAEINRSLPEGEAAYKNPRNLCSGSVRQLDSKITAERKVRFFAFGLVAAEGVNFENSRDRQMQWLADQGFEVVPYRLTDGQGMEGEIMCFQDSLPGNDFPSDGLVALFDDIAYGDSLGRTAKFPRNAFAFKWADETAETRLTDIEWSPSRTGLINPVAIFEPVELEGSRVTRASMHNISMLKNMELGLGDRITVYKANMIIPQLAENLTRSGFTYLPDKCPACGGRVQILQENDVEVLTCPNPACPAKAIKSFALFVSRDGLNIEGLSEARLEKWIGHGFLHRFGDIFRIEAYRDEIIAMEGFGEKSYEKLKASIDNARETTASRLLYGLGIPGVGASNARVICQAFEDDLYAIAGADQEALCQVEGIGPVIGSALTEYFRDPLHRDNLEDLLGEVQLEKKDKKEGAGREGIQGKTFVITGSLLHFANRSALKELIEDAGGKVTGSVSAKTDYLINNDADSASSKNQKAAALGIPVITEEDFRKLLG